MSMICCHMCSSFIDSDEFPDGFYVKGFEDKYICNSCRESNDLKTEFEEE